MDFLSVAGAGITVMGDGQVNSVCVSGPSIRALEDVQYEVGQGPCWDAFATGAWVHAPKLDDGAASKWPSFVSLAKSAGIGSVFSYPLLSSGAMIGVMTLYDTSEGELTGTQHDDSVGVAEVIAETLLSLQDDAPAGTLAPAFEASIGYRAQIHQAAGMTAVQLSIPLPDALLRIRAHAFANDQTISEAAAFIVARRLRLPDDHPETR